jgi:hypothetical protein
VLILFLSDPNVFLAPPASRRAQCIYLQNGPALELDSRARPVEFVAGALLIWILRPAAQ